MKFTALPITLKTTLWCILATVFVFGALYTTHTALAQTDPGVTPVTDFTFDPATDLPPTSDISPAKTIANNTNTGDINAEADPRAAREGISGWIYGILITIGGLFTWVGGNMLDASVEILVVGMGQLLNENIGVAVNNLWQVVRDIFNIFFIFGLIWIGISTIINSNSSQVKQQLSGIIIAALLINFSLFITKTVIDFTNIAATQIYNAFEVPNSQGTFSGIVTTPDRDGIAAEFAAGNTRRDISVAFMSNLRLTSFADEIQDDLGIFGIISFGFLMMFMMIIAGFVFMAGAILLIIRFVVLIILMIFSPAMFLGMIFPAFGKYSKEWWNKFFSNAFVAPAYLFMLYLCLSVFTGLSSTGTFASEFGGVVGVFSGSFAIFLYFGAMIAFLIAAVKVASSMSAVGAGTIEGIGMYGANKIRGAAVGVGRGAGNYGKRVGQNAGSAAYQKAALGFRGKDYAGAEKRLKERRAKKAKDRTWGDTIALGYAAARGAGSLDDRQAALKKGTEYKPFGGKSYKEQKEAEKALDVQSAQITEDASIKSAISAATLTGLSKEDADKANIAMEDTISKASASDFVGIAKSKEGATQIAQIAGSIPTNKWEKMMESDDVSPENKAILAAGRTKSTITNIERKDKDGKFEQGIKNASADELDSLEYEKVRENALYLQSGQMDDLRKKWGPEKFRILQAAQQKAFIESPIADVVASRKNNKEIAKLPKDILENYDFITHVRDERKLNADLLDKIATESTANKQIIGDKILNAFEGETPEWWTKYTRNGQGIKYTR